MNKLPTVIAGTFELPTGKVVEVGAASWIKWLESPEAKSFRFEGERGTFTARKETPKTGQPYWSAVRKIDQRLHKSYLGKSEALTLERLEEIAIKLTEPRPQKITQQATELGNYVTSPQSQVTQLQREVAELSRQLRQLQEELPKLIQSQVAAATGEQRLGESAEINRLREENKQLLRQLADQQQEIASLKTELDEARSQQSTATLPDLEALGVEVLASLKLGKQAPGYQGAKKAIAAFVKKIQT